jgi:hypothetical protein
MKRDAGELQGSLTFNEHLLENEQDLPAKLQLDAALNGRTKSGDTSGTRRQTSNSEQPGQHELAIDSNSLAHLMTQFAEIEY